MVIFYELDRTKSFGSGVYTDPMRTHSSTAQIFAKSVPYFKGPTGLMGLTHIPFLKSSLGCT